MSDKYLKLLAREFPNRQAVLTELVNLNAILSLPKGTEHFVSDLHGEYEAFQHLLKNGSGRVQEKIDNLFSETHSPEERRALAVLIYYPEEVIAKVSADKSKEEIEAWFLSQLTDLVLLLKDISAKYTRSKVRKAIAPDFRYIIEELLFTSAQQQAGSTYYDKIFESIIAFDGGAPYLTEMSQLIQQLIIDHLHVVGDIYDRGPAPDKIMDELMTYHSLDIQWGNHDTLWMGAGFGSTVCQANVIRICARYNNLAIIEEAYGMSIRFLVDFAKRVYPTPPQAFFPNPKESASLSEDERLELASIQQAMAMIQFKLEGQLIAAYPTLAMADRNHLSKINFDKLIYDDGLKSYSLSGEDFVTVAPDSPNELSDEESQVVARLNQLFIHSDKLQKHLAFLVEKGSMHLIYNDNLLYHGCIPLEENGEFQVVELFGERLSGKHLFDYFDSVIRRAYQQVVCGEVVDPKDLVLLWYLWTGKGSPLFGKEKMTTFERYYFDDPQTHVEKKNPYYQLRDNPIICKQILQAFAIESPQSLIVNGHTPVKEKRGETPIKGGGKLLVIDGGFSKPYQRTTGIAGYTLLFNSYGMTLAVHHPFCGKGLVVNDHRELLSHSRTVFHADQRLLVKDTDIGKTLLEQEGELIKLLQAFVTGAVHENK